MENNIKEIIVSSRYNELRVSVIYENGREEIVATLDSVNNKINDFMVQTKKNLNELIKESKVTYDSKKEKEIKEKYVVLNDKFVEREKVVTPREEVNDIEPIPVALPPESDLIDQPHVDSQPGERVRRRRSERYNNDHDTSKISDIKTLVYELTKLNPEAHIRYKSGDSFCYSTIPGAKLVLPKGFGYGRRVGINNAGHSDSDKFISLGVREYVREENHDKEDVADVSNPEKDNKKKKILCRIKNLVIYSAIGAVLITGYHIVVDGLGKKSTEPVKDNDKRYEQDVEDLGIETSFTSPLPYINDPYPEYEQGTPGRMFDEPQYTNYGSIVPEESMSSQLDSILELCNTNIADVRNFVQNGAYLDSSNFDADEDIIHLQNLVTSNEKGTISELCSARNSIVLNAYDNKDIYSTKEEINSFLIMLGDYVFNNSPVLNGKKVIPYQQLSPYSKYIVNTVGRTLLQTVLNYGDLGRDVEGTNWTYGEYNDKLYENYSELSEYLSNVDTRRK